MTTTFFSLVTKRINFSKETLSSFSVTMFPLTLYLRSKHILLHATVFFLSQVTFGSVPTVPALLDLSSSTAWGVSLATTSLDNLCALAELPLLQKTESHPILFKPSDVGHPLPFRYTFGKTLSFCRLCCSGKPLMILFVKKSTSLFFHINKHLFFFYIVFLSSFFIGFHSHTSVVLVAVFNITSHIWFIPMCSVFGYLRVFTLWEEHIGHITWYVHIFEWEISVCNKGFTSKKSVKTHHPSRVPDFAHGFWSGLLYREMTHESSLYQCTTLKLPIVTLLQVMCYFPTPIFCYQEISTRISWLEEKKMEIPSTYMDTWRKTNNIPDSDAIEAPAEHKERGSRGSHCHTPRNLDRYYIWTDNKLQKLWWAREQSFLI